jgi:hypothetical protein
MATYSSLRGGICTTVERRRRQKLMHSWREYSFSDRMGKELSRLC